MKGLLRSVLVQTLLASLVVWYVELMIATLRWRIEGRAGADAVIASDQGMIVLLWHGRIAHAMASRPILRDKPRRAMISLSRDGAFIARAAERLRIPTLRGSTARRDGGGALEEKGGAAAFRAAMREIAGGGVMLLTPDGPRGPNERLQIGPVHLARAGQCPVFLMGLAATPSLRLGAWDGGRIPLPFARACLVLDGPLFAPASGGAETLETTRAEWQARMCAAQARAERHIGKSSRL